MAKVFPVDSMYKGQHGSAVCNCSVFKPKEPFDTMQPENNFTASSFILYQEQMGQYHLLCPYFVVCYFLTSICTNRIKNWNRN